MLTIPVVARSDEAIRHAKRKISISSVLANPNLPSPPALVLQIVEKASKPGCDPGEVLALLSQDSGLCGQVLKTVNSGLFGLSKPVGSLKQAVLLLGIKPLRSLVLSLALPAIRIPERDDVILNYWQESVAGAVIARELARILRWQDPEDHLIAGLLRDLGILVFREACTDDYRALWRRCSRTWASRQCDEEREEFGVDHAELGSVLLEKWNLPPEIHQPIRFHHDPAGFADSAEPLRQRAWLLCFAGKVATLHSSSGTTVTELLQLAKQQFGLSQTELIKFLASVKPAIQDFATLLKVDIGQCPNYAGIITTGCQELVRLSVETSKSAQKIDTKENKPPRSDAANQTQNYVAPVTPNKSEPDTWPEFDLACLGKVPAGGVMLNGYQIKEILGRGAMGVVFKAYDPSLERFAAIKMLTPERVVLSEARDWFKREARAAAAIQHENVITIYAVSEMNGLPYLVMEYLPGESLQDRLDRHGALPLADVIRYGRQLANGLAAAHMRRVIHRDIKPANTLVSKETGSVKITDFGLARVLNDMHRSQEGMWVGTPLYMAPEQFNTSGVDHRADLFSLGSLLYTLCTGKTPFAAETLPVLMRLVCNSAPPPLLSLRREAPAWLANLITKLHAKLPASRYQSAADVIAEFDRHA